MSSTTAPHSPNSNTEGVGLRQLFTFLVDVTTPVSVGPSPQGEVRMVPIVGGSFSGEYSGVVLSGGNDWQVVRADGCIEISARYLLKTEAGEIIEVHSDGLRSGPIPYFRTAMRFRTVAPRLDALNNLLAVAYGQRREKQVELVVYAVL
ncbi:MAG: hypothetical protein RL701_4509 [Pseudomonadota bacterium]